MRADRPSTVEAQRQDAFSSVHTHSGSTHGGTLDTHRNSSPFGDLPLPDCVISRLPPSGLLHQRGWRRYIRTYCTLRIPNRILPHCRVLTGISSATGTAVANSSETFECLAVLLCSPTSSQVFPRGGAVRKPWRGVAAPSPWPSPRRRSREEAARRRSFSAPFVGPRRRLRGVSPLCSASLFENLDNPKFALQSRVSQSVSTTCGPCAWCQDTVYNGRGRK